MRILAVSHEASRTGSVRAFVEALPALRTLATELHVVVKEPGPMLDEIRTHATSVLVTPHPLLWQVRRSARARGLSGVAPAVERYVAREVMRAERPDFVYASTVLSSEYIAAARRIGIPSVLHVWEQEPLTSWAFARAKLDPLGLVAIAPSDFVAAELETLSATVISVLLGPLKDQSPLPTRPDDLPWSEDAFRVIACGSVAAWKGTEEFIEAATLLQSVDGRPVEWVWIGTGPDLEAVRALTVERGLPVQWLGERVDPAPYLESADVFVLPSRQETLGLVVLEAAAVGTPTIAFAVGGVPSIVRDPRALAAPGDVADLVGKLRGILVSVPLRHDILGSSQAAVTEAAADRWRERLSDAIAEAMRAEP